MAGIQQLAGRLALVTGGGSGIGRAVCKALSNEGARVIAADKNKEGAATTVRDLPGSHEHRAVEVDVGNSESVLSLFAEIKKSYSAPVSIVVNCAGILRDSFLMDMTEDAFDDVMKVNLKGTYLVTQAAAREMVASGVPNGAIVNISSIVGKTGNMGQCNYAASKAGVVGFTKTVALELARHNIRCNAIMPGFIETPMVASVPEKVLAKIMGRIPMGRFGKPEELANTVLFLCSPASSYVTGSVLEVTGGLYM
ncbi:estradiol 17-beta-dehydrogenase 8-like [Amblyomma americanum]